MKKLAVILFLVGNLSVVLAQQIPVYTQYMLNYYLVNPAVSGNRPGIIDTKISIRKQWVGLEGSPTTGVFSFHSYIPKIKSGVGAIIYSDRTGPTVRTGIHLNYAYHILVSDYNNGKLSFGLSTNFMEYRIKFEDLDPILASDPLISSSNQGRIGVDFNAGFFYYSDTYYAGISIIQLTKAKFKFEEADALSIAQLLRYYLIIAGYKYDINDNLTIDPSILVKATSASPIQYELGLKLTIKNDYWVGTNYRSKDAFSILAGLTIKDKLHIGYSYDFSISQLRLVSSGSHEILLGYDLKSGFK